MLGNLTDERTFSDLYSGTISMQRGWSYSHSHAQKLSRVLDR